ncbi:SDR family oxidoreductase [Leifsonia sp. AG29]|uniref:SDR family oxidoreductase n=1 Tax=Leifsonia sp. AG29 TaxID=2598860 RepID=UPI00131A7DC7|nr:SDR family oxidoreductase [Leifsonia sp. AG29]
MTIMVTGASGQLGRRVVENLLAQGVSAGEIIATGRDVGRLHQLAERGVLTRAVDFSDPAGLQSALTDVDRLLLVSTTTVGERFDNHRRVIDAARACNVRRIVYTSTLNAGSARMRLADEHWKTEQYLRASGTPFTILRNGWYLENYTSQLESILRSGVIVGAAGTGTVAGASRDDLAAAAAAVLTGDGHDGETYELGGHGFTLHALADIIAAETGLPIEYHDLPVAAFARTLAEAGLPAELAEVLADADAGLSRGELATESRDLERLLGRTPVTARAAVRDALRAA